MQHDKRKTAIDTIGLFGNTCHAVIAEGDVVINWAKPGTLARPVISRSNQRVTFKVRSCKSKVMLHAESTHERDFYRRADPDPAIKSIQPQPAVLLYLDAGRVRKHFPDCLVVKNTGTRTFVEIKAANDHDLAEARRRADLVTPGLLKLGYGYELVTSDAITAAPHLENARTLRRLGLRPVTSLEAESIRIALGQRPQTTWRDVCRGALGSQGPFHVARMILDGALVFDANKRLGAETVIQPLPVQE